MAPEPPGPPGLPPPDPGESSSSPESRRRFLLTNLGILSIFILTLLVLLAAYPTLLAPAPPPTETPTSTATITLVPSFTPTITLTPTQTRTPRPTFTPTVTLTPSQTPIPSLTPTPTGLPTLTPGRPAIGELYELYEASPERAQRMIDLMEGYPETLPRQARGANNENYYAAYSYAVTALSEAVLRFPDAPEAKAWRWRLAYDRARTDDTNAAEDYAALITTALNTGEVKLTDLSAWFLIQEPRLRLEVEPLPPISGYLSANLLSILGQGGAHLLLLETPGGFQAQVLSNDFRFVVNPKAVSTPQAALAKVPESASFSADLTGDGHPEVVFFHSDPGETFDLTPPRVFNLAQAPAQELTFNPALPRFDLGMDYINHWEAVKNAQGGSDLQFTTNLFPACPVQVVHTYHWTGEWFDLASEKYLPKPNRGTLSFCRLMAEHAANAWGPAATIQVMEPILPLWPPEKMEDGTPFPPDALDEWRFRLGVYHALVGDTDLAKEYFNKILTNPSFPASSWTTPAAQFLDTFKSPADLYRACIQVQFCDARLALKSIVSALPAVEYPRAITTLHEAGVTLRTSGYFDFDGDGVTEAWFLVRHRTGEKLEFWILVPAGQQVQALFVSLVESDKPRLELYDPEAEPPPVVLIDGTIAFTLKRSPQSQQPYLVYPELPKTYPDRFKEAVQKAKGDLFAGLDPRTVQNDLVALQAKPGLLCRGTWSCDEYYYLLGLSSELAGDTQAAIDAYSRLWWDYSKSPYTTLARLKLKGEAVQPTATPTGTVLPTAVGSLTPTVTGTPPTTTPFPTGGTPTTPTQTLTPTPATPYP